VPQTSREWDVLLMLTGATRTSRSRDGCSLTESTVSVHVSHIIAKPGVSNRLQAAATAQRLNFFPKEPDEV
jgi:DNA-binding NarL/FixJ family response regulator